MREEAILGRTDVESRLKFQPPSTPVHTSLSEKFHNKDERFFASPQSPSASINDFAPRPGMHLASKHR